MVLIIIAGMVIDVTPAMLILIPIMMPVIRQYGINPIAFGVASTLLFSQGLLTPPVGSILYVLADYTKMPVMRIAKNMIPYIITFMVLAFCFMMSRRSARPAGADSIMPGVGVVAQAAAPTPFGERKRSERMKLCLTKPARL